jgi:hypothetical protein
MLGAFPDFDDRALTAESADYSKITIDVTQGRRRKVLISSRNQYPEQSLSGHGYRGFALGLSLRRLLWVIERMYRLNLSIYDVNSVKNVIHSINSLHVEDGCNVISLDDVLL